MVSRLNFYEWFRHYDECHCVQCPVSTIFTVQLHFEFLELTKEFFISWPTSVRSVGNSVSSWFCYKPKTRFYWACDDVCRQTRFWKMKTLVILQVLCFVLRTCQGQRKCIQVVTYKVIYELRGPQSRYKMDTSVDLVFIKHTRFLI